MNYTVMPFTPEFVPTLPKDCKNKKILYFDIETTGLSAQSSYVYLIGCAYEKEQGYELTQWLCTDPSEEKELLRLFFEKTSDYEVVLHYNGTGFDLPFLEKKAKRHCLTNPLSAMESLDLYSTARSMKHLFALPNLKLKTMEQFFGFTRTDVFSGGDLIEVYAQFLVLHHLNSLTAGSKAEEENALAQVLLLHNAEDVMNLPALTVLYFLRNLSGYLPANTLQAELYDTPLKKLLSLTYSPTLSVPKDISFQLPWEEEFLSLELSAADRTVTLTLPVYEGERKYFYQNPADYYYLPLEDCAMHKSVASFVEKEYRKKATAATCYTKRTGLFLPLLKKEAGKDVNNTLPCFFTDYKSSFAYTPFSISPEDAPVDLTALTASLLRSLL